MSLADPEARYRHVSLKVAPRLIEALFQRTRPINVEQFMKVLHGFRRRRRRLLTSHGGKMLTENDLGSAADPVQSFQWMGGHNEDRSSDMQIPSTLHCLIRHCKIIQIDVHWSSNLGSAVPNGVSSSPTP